MGKAERAFTEEDLDLYDQYCAARAREDLWFYRQYMDPRMKIGWWPAMVSAHLQRFYERLVNGHRPKLLLMAPPQHGKSRGVQDFMGWVSGKNPDLRTIFASYSGNLGSKTNAFLQRQIDTDRYRNVFPMTQLSPLSGGGESTGRYVRNSTMFEFMEHRGFFMNTTVKGQVTGMSLDLGVVDDPMKGRAEAKSPHIRNSVWDWLQDDFMTRFDDAAGLLITMTRWHIDDPGGRAIEAFPDMQVLRFPALGTAQSIRENGEPRQIGEPLFPEFKSKEFLLQRKRKRAIASWESLYQQNPIVVGGGVFPIEKFKIIGSFSRKDIKRSVRYWDKAGTQGGGAYTCGVLMHLMNDGTFIIEDVQRGQWGMHEREARIKQAAQIDAANGRVEVWVEQEPGSGGKESAERTIANLKGFIAKADKVTGAKEIRAEPYAAQQQGGNVYLLRKPWVRGFIDEHETFPTGKYKDQVDASAGACVKLSQKTYNYDTSMKWAGRIT